MKRFAFLPVIFLLIWGCEIKSRIKIQDLRCEYLENPLAIDQENPRFSWMIASPDSGFHQKAYQVRLFLDPSDNKSEKKMIWKSDRIDSNSSNQVYYRGPALDPNTGYLWSVRIWDDQNKASAWCEPARFHTGLNLDWRAKWIGKEADTKPVTDFTIPPSPLLRKEFNSSKKITKAILFSSAKGIYNMYLNAEKIGSDIFAPGWTDYNKRIYYQAHDVSQLIQEGNNCLSVILSDGWYAGRLGTIDFGFENFPWRGYYGRDLRFIGQLEIWYDDGTRESLNSDESWTCFDDGPFRSADHFIGVTYDFNYVQEGWQNAGFDDSAWLKVSVEEDSKELLVSQPDQPVEVIRELTPIGLTEPKEGVYVVDMGQNMVGWIRAYLTGNPGDTIVLKHAEMLTEEGVVYRDNLRNAPQIDIYILGKEGEVRVEPLFTFHGFRFVQIEGLNSPPPLEGITGVVVSSAAPETGTFSCSNPMLNKLWENIRWTQWGNMVSVPTDCPQRSERMGWMGDAQVFAQTAIFNLDMSAFFTKWGYDVMDAQFETGEFSDVSPRGMPFVPRFWNAPGWADAGLIVPWRLYENYADLKALDRHYLSMKKYVDRILETNPDLIYTNTRSHQYNDWLNGNTIISDDYPKAGGEIPRPVFNTAFFIRSTRIVAKSAELLGKTEDAIKYNDLADRTNEMFLKEFVSEDGVILGETQAGYAIALSFGLLPDSIKPLAVNNLVKALKVYDNRMSTGFISTICMLDELSRNGYHELACQLAESHRLPSWGYSIDQGATTIWERWDAYVKGRGFQNAGMNSFNHYTFGAIGEWMVKHLLGIQPDDNFPGFRHFFLEPKPGGSLTSASGEYNSINGTISMAWELRENKLNLIFSIPANTTASFILPSGYLTEVEINGNKIAKIPVDRIIELGSGSYEVNMVSK